MTVEKNMGAREWCRRSVDFISKFLIFCWYKTTTNNEFNEILNEKDWRCKIEQNGRIFSYAHDLGNIFLTISSFVISIKYTKFWIRTCDNKYILHSHRCTFIQNKQRNDSGATLPCFTTFHLDMCVCRCRV